MDYLALLQQDIVHVKEQLALNPNINPTMIKQGGGSNVHFRGYQDKGKTMSMVRMYQHLIDHCGYLTTESVGNLHIGSEIDSKGLHYGGKYGEGYQALKGDDLRQYLWDMVHKPYRHRIMMIDEIDSEFPARNFQEKEQTELMTRLWHNMKLRNFIMYTSHLGNGTDLILRLATNFVIIPQGVDLINNIIPITVINAMDGDIYDADITNVHKALENYDRWEETEVTEEETGISTPRPISKAKKEALMTVGSTTLLRSAKDSFKHIKEAYHAKKNLL